MRYKTPGAVSHAPAPLHMLCPDTPPASASAAQYRKVCWNIYLKQHEAGLPAFLTREWRWHNDDGSQESVTTVDLPALLDSEELPGSTVLTAAQGSRQATARALREESINRPALLRRLKAMKAEPEAVQVGAACLRRLPARPPAWHLLCM